MERVRKLLKTMIFVEVGAGIGNILAKYLHYAQHPHLYDVYSAPWYWSTGIMITAFFTAVIVTLTAIAYFVTGYIIKRRKRILSEEDSRMAND